MALLLPAGRTEARGMALEPPGFASSVAVLSPAAASLRVYRVPRTGPQAEIPDWGEAWVGDKLRVVPSFTPSNLPLIDWGLDYDFHGVGSLDRGTADHQLAHRDVSAPGTLGESTVYGPCDLQNVGTPATGANCWASVTTNSSQTTGTPPEPDFPASPAPGFSKQLTIALEVRNAENPVGTSSVALHRINWKVPLARLKSTAILSGGIVTDDSQGSPIPTGYKWYFSSVKQGETGSDVLTLRSSCLGTTCNPNLSQPGSYRYWVTVSYDGGFATPACPNLSADGQTCSGDAAKTITVTDVVLGFTVPATAYVGTGSLGIPSSSIKGAVEGCDGVNGFSYDLCQQSGGSCTEGSYTGSGLSVVGDPFAGGSLTIPKPAEGSWGVRIRYQYAPAGGCASQFTVKWPADGGYAPLVMSRLRPTIRLTNSTGTNLCVSNPIFGEECTITVGQTGRAWAYLDGVMDSNPPAALSWAFGNGTTGTVQGAQFSYTATGTYLVTLSGYGDPVTKQITATPAGGGGGGGGAPLTVSTFAVSNQAPAIGASVAFSCAASGGTPPYQYRFDFGDGQSRPFSSATTATHSYSTAGTYYAVCRVTDSASGSIQSTVRVITVQSAGGGGEPPACSLSVKDAAQGIDLQQGVGDKYYVTSGQLIRLEASGVTTTVNWVYGDGRYDFGTPKTFSYTNNSGLALDYTLTMTSGASCSLSRTFNVSPASSPDFSIHDAATDALVAWDPAASAFPVASGQALRFKATGTTGTVSWSFGDGTISTETNPVKTYVELVDKPYTVTLSANARTKTKSVLVRGATGAPLTGAYSFAYTDGKPVNPAEVVANEPIRFTGIDQAEVYLWDFGDGSPLAQGSPREHTFTRAGTYVVRLTAGRSGSQPVTTPYPTAFTVVPEPDPLLWVAGGMAYVDGRNGERFQSDLSIFNPGSRTATLSVAFVSGSGWDGATKAEWRTFGVGPGETRAFPNVLATLFGLAKGAWGVLLVRGDDVPATPVIVSRTYNAANAAEKGTFGLSVPTTSVAGGVRPQGPAGGNFLAGLRHDASFRTNLTVANLKPDSAEVEVVFRDAAGTVLGSPARVTVEGNGVKQVNAVLEAPVAGDGPIGGAGFTQPVSHFSAEVRLRKGSGVYPYATVIDQGTGDSIVVTPAPRPAATSRLPGIVRVKGRNGPYWVSDLALLNPGAHARKVLVSYSYEKAGAPQRLEVSRTMTLAPFQMAVAVDFVRQWLLLAADDPNGYASSFIDVGPALDDGYPAEPLVVNGKTYTPAGAGSIGLQVDAFVSGDGVGGQTAHRKIVLGGLEANAAYRTNVALFLTPGSTGSVQVDVRVLDSFGREAKKFANVGLDADTPSLQLNSADLFSTLATTEWDRASIVIDNPRGTGRVAAYATVIDNKSEDATFVAGQTAP